MNKFSSYKKWLNEKFVEDSDPVHDLGIGMKKKLEPFTIYKNKLNAVRFFQKENDYLSSVFGPNFEDEIYFIGDFGDFTYNYPKEYIDYVKTLLTRKNLIDHIKIDYENVNLYQTPLGKIMEFSVGEDFYFVAEFDVAAELYIKYLK